MIRSLIFLVLILIGSYFFYIIAVNAGVVMIEWFDIKITTSVAFALTLIVIMIIIILVISHFLMVLRSGWTKFKESKELKAMHQAFSNLSKSIIAVDNSNKSEALKNFELVRADLLKLRADDLENILKYKVLKRFNPESALPLLESLALNNKTENFALLEYARYYLQKDDYKTTIDYMVRLLKNLKDQTNLEIIQGAHQNIAQFSANELKLLLSSILLSING